MNSALPKLRLVEAFPVEVEGQQLICLHDPLQYATESIAIAAPAFFILTMLDGVRGMVDVQAAFAERFGAVVGSDDIRELLATLDRHHFLDSARFAARRAEIGASFRAATVRAAAHAGTSYPAEPGALHGQLDGFFSGVPSAPSGARLRGVIAPHIDLRVGGTGYGHAYHQIASADRIERVVILGTAHYGGATLFAATRKDFATPLGTVVTDRDFLDRLAARTPQDLYADELLHRTEHAVEFQTVMLQHVLGARGPFSVVPILVTSFHEMVHGRRSPSEDARVADFVAALRATLAEDDRPTVVIAAVDFAHVGAKFGDAAGLAPEILGAAEAKDRRLIAALESGDPERFFETIAADGDRTRVCGLSALYTFLALLDGAPGRLLHYDRTRDETTRSSVSYAALVYTDDGDASA
jgi:MEMO1 family protein